MSIKVSCDLEFDPKGPLVGSNIVRLEAKMGIEDDFL